MKILIVNQPPFNRGDESAHKGLVRTLLGRLPNVEIRVIYEMRMQESIRQFNVHDNRVKYIVAPKFLGLEFVKRIGMTKSMEFLWHCHPLFYKYRKIYKWADIVLCAPGGICMGGFQDWQHLFMLKLSKFYNRPLAYYGRSFGPFPTETQQNRTFKKLSIEMLHYFCFISIRENKSELLAKSLGVNYIKTTDSAFLDDPIVNLPYEIKYTIGQTPYMVFVPNYLLWHYAYKDKFTHGTVIDFYCRVIDEVWNNNPNLYIVMLPQTFCMDDYPTNDLAFFRDIAEKKNDKRVIVISDSYSSDIQQKIISNAEYVIGGRYHSVVFAINQGVPVIALSYEHKIVGLMETLNLQEFCVDFTNTLKSPQLQNICINNISEMIKKLRPTTNNRNYAKSVASQCMDKFIEIVNKD